MSDQIESKEARHGKRMIEVKVRFWTDGLAEGRGQIRPKHALSSGVVRLKTNDAHGLKASKRVPFNSLAEIPFAIEKVLIAQGIKIHLDSRMRKYVTAE